MNNIDFNKFQKACIRTANPNIDYTMALLNWTLGIVGEAGEFAELIKKHNFHGILLDIEKAKKELGDILYYIANAATTLGLNLEDIAQANVDKLLKRYPNGFVEGGGIR